MQHPDEGTIHSWLDGALSAEDAAGVESHVAECAQCKVAVAEARGFIAASSRILTALDDVPRGVIPVAPARRRDLRVFWRAAAAVLVVAGGSLIVLRDDGEDARVVSSETAPAILQSASGTISKRRTAQATTRAENPPSSPERDLAGQAGATRTYSSAKVLGSVAGIAAQTMAADAAPIEQGADSSVNSSPTRTDPFKLLGMDRMIGTRRTIYVAAGDTVTLTETISMSLEAVVTTGTAGVEQQSRASGARAVAPTSARSTASAPPPAPLGDSQQARGLATALLGAVTQTNTISWTEAATGQRLTLSGKLPVQRLQEIRLRIERERAASSKKVP